MNEGKACVRSDNVGQFCYHASYKKVEYCSISGTTVLVNRDCGDDLRMASSRKMHRVLSRRSEKFYQQTLVANRRVPDTAPLGTLSLLRPLVRYINLCTLHG